MTDTNNNSDRVLLFNAEQVHRSLHRVAHEILERNDGASKIAIVGIRTRGENLAARLRAEIEKIDGCQIDYGVLDITLYRDDITASSGKPIVRASDLPFDLAKRTVILVDDVLFTGRTVRAALDAINDFGRPVAIQLAVLIDRGHQEVPIRADYVGRTVPTGRRDSLQVALQEVDGEDAVYTIPRTITGRRGKR